MAETKKPAARKKTTAKRGPTKAAALKALGITQEDLDLIKQVAEARKRLTEEAPATSQALAEDPVNQQFAAETGAPPQAVEEVAEEPTAKNGPWYARNRTNSPCGFRLERQQGPGKKRLELKPRGQRGDLVKLQDGDLDDEGLILQLKYGVIEIVSGAEARQIIEKQSNNAQQQMHPAMATLRNELGEMYGERDQYGNVVRQQESIQVQGDNSVTVAHLKPQGGEAGALPDLGRGGIDWQAARNGPVQAGIGGNPAIISDGFAPPTAQVQDQIARQKGVEGPAAGLGGLNVTVEPTQKT